MGGRIVRCGIVSSCQSADTSESANLITHLSEVPDFIFTLSNRYPTAAVGKRVRAYTTLDSAVYAQIA